MAKFEEWWKEIPDDQRDEGIDHASAKWGWNLRDAEVADLKEKIERVKGLAARWDSEGDDLKTGYVVARVLLLALEEKR